MSTYHDVTLHVRVFDPNALFDACLATADEHTTEEELRDLLLDDQGNVSVPDCLRWMADPGQSWGGTEILDSTCD